MTRRTSLRLAAGTVLALCAATPLRAATPAKLWDVEYTRTGGGDDQWLAAAVVSGTTYIFHAQNFIDYRLARISPAGVLLSDIPMDPPVGFPTRLSMALAPNGEVVIAGQDIPGSDFDLYISKYDATGTLLWSQYYDSGSNDQAGSVAVDATGEILLPGITGFVSLDAELVKFDAGGTFQWDRFVDLGFDDEGIAVATDPSNNAYLVGTEFDTVAGDYQRLIAKYDGGGAPQWTVTIAGAGMAATAVLFDTVGNRVVTAGSDFFQTVVATLNPATGAVLATGVDPDVSNYHFPGSIAMAPGGSLYVSAQQFDTTFAFSDIRVVQFDPSLSPTWQEVIDTGDTDGSFDWMVSNRCGVNAGGVTVTAPVSPFLCGLPFRLTARTLDGPAATRWLWVQTAPGAASQTPTECRTDGAGGVYVSVGDGSEPFLLKYGTNGAFQWARFPSEAGACVTDGNGLALAGGSAYLSTTVRASHTFETSVNLDRYDAAGNLTGVLVHDLIPGTTAGPIVGDGAGNVYLAASFFNSTIFEQDLLVAKFGPAGTLIWTTTLTLAAFDGPTGIALDGSGGLYVCEPVDGGGGWEHGLVKLDTAGNVQWTASFPPALGTDGIVMGVACAGAGVYLAGADNDGGTFEWWARLLRIDTNGGLVWSRTENAGQVAAWDGVTTDPCGNIDVTGETGASAPSNAIVPSDTLTAAYDAGGGLRWLRTDVDPAGDSSGDAVAPGSLYVARDTPTSSRLMRLESAPALAGALSVVPSPILVGQWAEVRLTVTNTGGEDAVLTVPFLQLNAGAASVTLVAGPAPAGPLTVLAGGATTFVWTLSAAGSGAVTLSATAISAACATPLVVAKTGALIVTGPAALDASLSAVSVSGTAYVGQQITLRLTVTNTGASPATTLVPAIQVTAGAGLVIVLGPPVPVNLNSLAPLATTMFVWSFSVSGSGAVTMTATVTATDSYTSGPIADSATVGFLTATRAKLVGALSVSPVSGTAFLGDVFTVTLTVTNTGELPATGVLPLFQLNSGTALLASLAGPVPPGPLTIQGGSSTTFVWTFSVAGKGIASMTMTAQGGDGGGGVTAAAVTRVEILRKVATLDATLVFSPPGAVPGQAFAVAMVVVNTGEYPATGLVPFLLLTSGAGSATLVAPVSPPNLLTLAPGSATFFFWTWSATAIGAIQYTVSVTALGAPLAVSIGDRDSGTFYVALPAVLSSTLAVSPATATVFVGQVLSVTMTVTNTGTQTALSLQSFPAAFPFPGLDLRTLPAPFTVTSLPPGSATTFVWTFTVAGRADLVLTLSVSGDDGTGALVTTGSTAYRYLREPAALLVTLSTPSGSWVPGNHIPVLMTVSNTGDVPATGVLPFLDVNLGAGLMTPFSGPSPASVPTLAAHSAAIFTWTFSAQGAGTVRFTTTAQGLDTGLGGALLGAASSGGVILPKGMLSARLTATPLIVSQGDVVTVVLSVSNSGSSAVWSVSPSGTAPSAPLALTRSVTGPVPGSLPVVNPAETRSYTWTYVAAGPGTVSFSASALGWESVGGTPLPVFAVSNTILIEPVPLLSGVFAVAPGPFKPGQTVTVWLTVTNAGSATAYAVAPVLGFTPPGLVAGVLGPAPGAATILPGSATTFVWSFLAADGGTVALAGNVAYASLSGTTSVESVMPPVAGEVVILPRPEGDIAVFPNPLPGGADTATIALRLRDDAREVTVDAYDASMHRVWTGTWKNIARLDGTLDVRGLSGWAPGVYLIRVRADLAGGGAQTFPVAKLVVKP